MIPRHTSIRILSIILLIASKYFITDYRVWMSITLSLGLGHYSLSLVYAKNQYAQLVQNTHLLIPLSTLIILGTTLYLTNFPLVIFFSFHHVLNEVYLVNRAMKIDDEKWQKLFRTSAVILNFFIYFVILRDNKDMAFIDIHILYNFLYIGLAISYLVFLFSLFKLRKTNRGSQFIDSCAFEIMGLILVIASHYVQIKFLDVVCYHFIFWIFYPISKLAEQGTRVLTRYLLSTFVVTTIVFMLSPAGLFFYRLSNSLFWSHFIFWSYIHVTSSFALSNAHPRWLLKLFRPVTSP